MDNQVLSILEKSTTFTPAPETINALRAVKYSQRFALAYLFDASIAAHVQALGWTSKYVSRDEDDVVRYLCWDNLKKQPTSDAHYALLVHTSVPFGVQHMDKKLENDAILATVSQSVKKLLPFLPDEEDVILHRWRYVCVTHSLMRLLLPVESCRLTLMRLWRMSLLQNLASHDSVCSAWHRRASSSSRAERGAKDRCRWRRVPRLDVRQLPLVCKGSCRLGRRANHYDQQRSLGRSFTCSLALIESDRNAEPTSQAVCLQCDHWSLLSIEHTRTTACVGATSDTVASSCARRSCCCASP